MSDEDEDETILVLLTQRGDSASFERLLRRMHRPLRAYVTSLVGASTADDVLQEVALCIYRQIRWLREPPAFRAWTFRIATRMAFVHLKKEKRWNVSLDADPERLAAVPDPGPLPGDLPDAAFLELANHASTASRAVLLLHYQQHLSLEETAAILDIPLGTAKSRLAYGIATLRKRLIEEKQHDPA